VGTAGIPLHVTVSLTGGAVNTAGGAGVTVMVLVTGVSTRPQASVAVQVSVIVPPHGPGVAEKVDVFEVPVIRQEPVSPLVYVSVEDVGVTPQAIVMPVGAVITGSAAGVTVMVLDPLMVLLHTSVKIQLSVSVPPHPVTAPVLVAVTVPEIRQVPLPLFV
jgi:hypothetical protein